MDVQSSEKYWQADSKHELFHKVVGNEFGNNPSRETNQIQQYKSWMTKNILNHLNANKESYGLEIGPGCGHCTKAAAEVVKFIHAVDISDSFLDASRKTCEHLPNVQFTKIKNGDISFLQDNSIDFCFSMNVFIHLNLFEIVGYLREIHRALKVRGRAWFDIVDADSIQLSDPLFMESYESKKQEPFRTNCLTYNSPNSIKNIATQIGFRIEHIHFNNSGNVSFLLEKA